MKKKQSSFKILIADDEEKIRISLSGLLRDYGYEITTTSSALECLKILSTETFDLVILDIVMPEINGIEVLQQIKEKYKDTEVIIMTGYADKEKAIASLRFNAYDFIEKPFESKEIMNTICHCLEQKVLRSEIERKNIELRESEAKYRSIFHEARDGIVLIERETGCIFDCNEEFEKQTGRKIEHLKKMKMWELMTPEKKEDAKIAFSELNVKDAVDKIDPEELRFQKPDGSIIPIEITSKTLVLRSKQYIQSITRDITERKKTDKQIQYLSFHDKLTGCYNRAYFEEEIKRFDVERQLPISLIFGDVNGLKLLNDAFGHEEGDRLLCNIAKILSDLCRKEDIVARWGGDEFAVILLKTNEDVAFEVCNRIKQACNKADSEPIKPSLALGVATKTKACQDIKKVLKEAENMMYSKKLEESNVARNSFIFSLMRSLVERKYECGNHINRLQQMTMKIGYEIRLSEEELEELNLLSSLHDIGNLAIPDRIVMKPDRLTKDEWKAMKKHPEIGYRIAQYSHRTASIAETILTHHERWDGSGYPMGINGNDIPFISRIFSIVDAYDVMTHDKIYRKAMPHEKALIELRKCAGTQFDPKLVEIFTEIIF
jgi:diguanylate cyclase (GGDEF)-like protein/PAS domain S-box-containing protein